MTANLSLPVEIALEERDSRHLRKAIGWSHAAARRGNRPFGAVIVLVTGEVIAEAHNNTAETSDCTGHAELNAIRFLAGRGYTRDALAEATLYASGEPCVMCAGAIFWSAIGRVVFGIDAQRLDAFRSEPSGQHGVGLTCRAVFNAASHPVECIGPALLDEASAPHIGAWNAP